MSSMIIQTLSSFLIIAASAPLLLADDLPEDLKSSQQNYVFDISHVNHAWGYRHKGYFVDSRGYIYSYDHSGEKWEYEDATELEDKILALKFKNRKLFAKIESRELSNHFKLIEIASRGQISPPVSRCNDFGSIRYTAYLFDTGKNSYTPVKIYQAGDTAWRNLSDEAWQIYRWLNSIIYEGKPHPCVYSNEQ